MSFQSDIAKFAAKTNTSADEVFSAVAIKLFNGIILDTRVDTGRLRGNWQLTQNNPADGEVDTQDRSGSITTSAVTNGVKARSVNYLTNNLAYARAWEEEDGMIAKNTARIKRNLKEAVQGVR